jgi:lambda repressor-like predicted transcriptional regulator
MVSKSICSNAYRREYIKYQLRLRGTSLSQVGREIGVTTVTMSQVCLGIRTSERVWLELAHRLDVSTETLKAAPPMMEDPM